MVSVALLGLAATAPAPAAAGLAATYANPVGDDPARQLANPAVLRVVDGSGTTFYAYGGGATFASPALTSKLPIRTSTDLSTWSAPIDGQLSAAWASSSVSGFSAASVAAFAANPPAQRYVAYFTAIEASTGRRCIGMATAAAPIGPFVDPAPSPATCPFNGARDPSLVLGDAAPQLLYYASNGSASGTYRQVLLASGLGPATSGGGTPQPAELVRPMNATAWGAASMDRPAALVVGGTAYLFYGGGVRSDARHAVGWSRCRSHAPIADCTDRRLPGPFLTTTESVASPGGFQPFLDDAGQAWMAYDALPGGRCVGTCSGSAQDRTLRIDPVCADAAGPRTVAPTTGPRPTARVAPCRADQPAWATTAASAMFPLPGDPLNGALAGTTLRQGVHSTIGGRAVRVTLSNEAGTAPLGIHDATIALNTTPSGDNKATQGGAARVPLTFGGRTAVSIPVGGTTTSDAVALAVPADHDLAVSLYVSGDPGAVSGVRFGGQSAWKAPGDRATPTGSGGAFSSAGTINAVVAAVDVLADAVEGTVVVLGDSKSDGGGNITLGANQQERYSDVLARRLIAAGRTVGVANVASAGNSLLPLGAGDDTAGTARIGRDVLARADVHTVIVALGTNDLTIAQVGGDIPTSDMASLQTDLRAGLRSLVAQAHADGIRVIGTTVPPLGGPRTLPGCIDPGPPPPRAEMVRDSLNAWITSYSGPDDFDQVVDLAGVLADPAATSRIRCGYQLWISSAHPDVDGHQADGDAFSLPSLLP